jgi:hypothetical protein
MKTYAEIIPSQAHSQSLNCWAAQYPSSILIPHAIGKCFSNRDLLNGLSPWASFSSVKRIGKVSSTSEINFNYFNLVQSFNVSATNSLQSHINNTAGCQWVSHHDQGAMSRYVNMPIRLKEQLPISYRNILGCQALGPESRDGHVLQKHGDITPQP